MHMGIGLLSLRFALGVGEMRTSYAIADGPHIMFIVIVSVHRAFKVTPSTNRSCR